MKIIPVWILIVVGIVALSAMLSHADLVSLSGSGMQTKVNLGSLSLNVPLNEMDVTYLYDIVAKRNLVGGETPIATLWKIQGTLGVVTSLDGQGAPYAGGKLVLPSLSPNLGFLSQIQPGIFGGYDWNRGSAIAGFKADIPIFN